MMRETLNAIHDKRNIRSPVVSAKIVFEEESFYFGRCLLDTGASGRNYITESSLAKLMRYFSSEIRLDDCNAGVILGDAKTHLLIDKKVTLTLIMPAEALHGTAVTLDFLVFSTGYDIVIGINDILDHFLHVLWDALGGSRMVEYDRMNNLVDEVSTSELIESFDSILETSPEELSTPETCSLVMLWIS